MQMHLLLSSLEGHVLQDGLLLLSLFTSSCLGDEPEHPLGVVIQPSGAGRHYDAANHRTRGACERESRDDAEWHARIRVAPLTKYDASRLAQKRRADLGRAFVCLSLSVCLTAICPLNLMCWYSNTSNNKASSSHTS